jgi:DNA-directed RNA polymerase I, II, and III subunit RPABC2
MSDNESDYYSGTNSESDDSDNEIEIKPKPLIFNPNTIEAYDSDEEEDADIEDVDAEDVDVEDDEQKGGADDLAYVSEEEEDEDEDDDDEDIELDEDGEPIQKGGQKSVKPKKITPAIIDDNDEDEDDEYDENYLQKFDSEITKSYINDFHPECLLNNYDEISKLTVVVRNSDNIIVDPLHRTIPYLTKYEKARVLGQRAKQIETGAKPLVRVPENIVDGYIIAELELREKKIPFIIRRPIPSGAFEYWKLADLENIDF